MVRARGRFLPFGFAQGRNDNFLGEIVRESVEALGVVPGARAKARFSGQFFRGLKPPANPEEQKQRLGKSKSNGSGRAKQRLRKSKGCGSGRAKHRLRKSRSIGSGRAEATAREEQKQRLGKSRSNSSGRAKASAQAEQRLRFRKSRSNGSGRAKQWRD